MQPLRHARRSNSFTVAWKASELNWTDNQFVSFHLYLLIFLFAKQLFLSLLLTHLYKTRAFFSGTRVCLQLTFICWKKPNSINCCPFQHSIAIKSQAITAFGIGRSALRNVSLLFSMCSLFLAFNCVLCFFVDKSSICVSVSTSLFGFPLKLVKAREKKACCLFGLRYNSLWLLHVECITQETFYG